MEIKDLLDYLELKAKNHIDIRHLQTADKKAFAVVDNPYDLDEFDNILRNSSSFPMMLAEVSTGRIEDISANFVHNVGLSFMILDKVRDGESKYATRSRCFRIGREILQQIYRDKPNNIISGKMVRFELNTNYQPVGPMNSEYWGYQFEFSFIVPQGFCG